jgi:HEAT repeat protein
MRLIKIMTHIAVISTVFIGCHTYSTNNAKVQSHRDEIDSLLERLRPAETYEEATTRKEALSIETQQNVQDSLMSIAKQTPEARAEVVEALIRVAQDPQARAEGVIASRWTMAVKVLGELKATEAIDILIANLGETGQNGIVISLGYHPVAQALVKIGEPAIPRLMEVWSSDNDDEIRHQAEVALVNIGKPAIPVMQDALYHGGVRERGRAAWVLAWIGDKDAGNVIKDAIVHEKDPEVLVELRGALKEVHNRWG